MSLHEQYINILQEVSKNYLSRIFQKEKTQNYDSLSSEEKLEIQEYVKKRNEEVEGLVNSITSNGEYIKWIYKQLFEENITFPKDFEETKELILNFDKLLKLKKFKDNYKNIFHFDSIKKLSSVISKYNKETTEKKYVIDYGINPIIYEKNNIKVIELLEWKDSYNMIKSTRWCLKMEDYFNNIYSPSFYIILKNDKLDYVIHLNTYTLRDTKDVPPKKISAEVFDAIKFIGKYENVKMVDLFKKDFVVVFEHLTEEEKKDTQPIVDKMAKHIRIVLRDTKKRIEEGIIDGDVTLSNLSLTKIPEFLKNVKITGNLDLSFNNISSFENCPQSIGGELRIHHNEIKSLIGCPRRINGIFLISYNELEELNYFPIFVKYGINVSYNNITSLKGLPKKINGYLKIHENMLTSFEDGPEVVKGDLLASYNNITSLRGFPRKVIRGKINLSNNPIEFSEEDINKAKEISTNEHK